MDAFTGIDRLGLLLSGGAANTLPTGSLGGVISSRAVRGMMVQWVTGMSGLVVEDATFENGEGTASISILSDVAYYTPPGGSASDQGEGIAVASGERKVLRGSDLTKAVRVYRVPGGTFKDDASFKLVNAMNGVLSMGNIADADRQAGEVFYRAVFIKCLGASAIDISAWVETSDQSSFSLAKETPVANAIQTIASETTAPTGLTWVDAISEGSAIAISDMVQDDIVGLWIRRTFPAAGVVASREAMQLKLKFKGW